MSTDRPGITINIKDYIGGGKIIEGYQVFPISNRYYKRNKYQFEKVSHSSNIYKEKQTNIYFYIL